MKKRFLLLSAMALFVFAGYAQVNPVAEGILRAPSHDTKISNYTKAPKNDTKNKAGRSDWFSPVDLATANGASYSGATFSRLFPDSFVNILYTDGIGSAATHSIGSCFDPTNPLYVIQATDGYEINKFDSYNVDSVRFSYLYLRERDSIKTSDTTMAEVVDTLFFYYLAPDDMNRFSFTDDALGGFGVPIALDQANLRPRDFAYVDTILLTPDMVTAPDRDNFTSGRLTLPIPAGVGFVQYDYSEDFGGLPVGASITYKPGIPYSMGDTIISFDDNVVLENLYNDFGAITFGNEGAEIIELEAYNNSFVCNRQVRYGQALGSVSGHLPFIKRFGWTRDVLVDFDFFISEPAGEEWASVSDKLGTLRTTVYPNPVTAGKSIFVKIDEAANLNEVEISLSDVIGNIITSNTTLVNGSEFNVSTMGLTEGIYFVNVKTGSKSSTSKVIINK